MRRGRRVGVKCEEEKLGGGVRNLRVYENGIRGWRMRSRVSSRQ